MVLIDKGHLKRLFSERIHKWVPHAETRRKQRLTISGLDIVAFEQTQKPRYPPEL